MDWGGLLNKVKAGAAVAAEQAAKAGTFVAEKTVEGVKVVQEETPKLAAVVAAKTAVVAEETKKTFANLPESSAKFAADAKVVTTNAALVAGTHLSAGARFVATTTVEGAQSVAKLTNETIADLGSAPTEVTCSGCQALLRVPSSVFDWECVNSHPVPGNLSECPECKDTKPIGMDASKPSVICPTCSTPTVIPPTKALLKLQQAPMATKNFIVNTGTAVSKSVETMAAAPDEFNCKNCHSLLHVPTGPWVCQTCKKSNAEDVNVCLMCEQRKADQQVLCGVCRQFTTIPQTNLANMFHASVRSATNSTTKLIMQVQKKQHATCQLCGTHVACDGSDNKEGSASIHVEENGDKTVGCHICNSRVIIPAAPAAATGDAKQQEEDVLVFNDIADEPAPEEAV